MRKLLTFIIFIVPLLAYAQSSLTIVELNTENLFDTRHDSLKNDFEFLPDSPRHWTRTKYWEKLNRIWTGDYLLWGRQHGLEIT